MTIYKQVIRAIVLVCLGTTVCGAAEESVAMEPLVRVVDLDLGECV